MSYKYKAIIMKYYKVALLVSFGFFFMLVNEISSKEITEVIQPIKDEVVVKKTETAYVYVDIKGSINEAGVYKMEENARVIDVVTKAGGFTKEAELKNVNLSKKLKDEMLIYIPKITEEVCITEPVKGGEEGNSKISINQAPINILTTLPGIGASKANDIIKYRTEKGLFKTIEELKNVSGIGDATFKNIKDLITI